MPGILSSPLRLCHGIVAHAASASTLRVLRNLLLAAVKISAAMSPGEEIASLSEEVVGTSHSAVHEAIDRMRRAQARWSEIELPPLSSLCHAGFAGDADTLKLIASTVREIAPRHVIEFGCGSTTELLAQLGFEHGHMAVTTFEHDPWAAEYFISVAGGQAINYRWFSFAICPLVARRCGGTLRPVYDDGMIVPTVPFPADLIVITGPPQTLGGRGGTLFQALKYARPGTIVLLLDVRAEEDDVIDDVLRDLARHLLIVPPGLLHRHLAFVVHEPMAEPFTLWHSAEEAQAVASSERASPEAAGCL